MAQNDYAILVGISRYADPALQSLEGPVADVRLMRDWIVSPQGGNVPSGNITCIVSDESVQLPAADDEMPPVYQDFLDAFLLVVRKPGEKGFLPRRDGRLYLFFSGHGFCEKYLQTAHAALYAANADRDINWNIYGTYYAQWAKGHGLFGEIVLIMDCCRDAELSKQPLKVPLRNPTDIGVPQQVKLFELYAAPRGGKAQERKIPSRNNEVHGLLTHAFLDAISHADPDAKEVSTHAIKGYLEQRWNALCVGVPADPPEIIVPSNGEIKFTRPVSAAIRQHFKLKLLGAGSSFKIIRADLSDVATVMICPNVAQVSWADGSSTDCKISDNIFVVPLPATYYMVVAATAGGALTHKFQAGDDDVEL